MLQQENLESEWAMEMPSETMPIRPGKSRQRRQPRWPDPTMNFLIAYDISEGKRLKRVAKAMEQFARRVQYSVFIFTGSRRELEQNLVAVIEEIDPTVDRVQAWPIRTSTKAVRLDYGTAVPDTGIALVIGAEQWTVIEAIDDPHSHPPLLVD